jgi:hypothetical protein
MGDETLARRSAERTGECPFRAQKLTSAKAGAMSAKGPETDTPTNH